MKRRSFAGLPIIIENPAGSIRHWYDRAGRSKGSTLMHFDYGFIEGHRGSDGDDLDCYIGPNEAAREVHVVHQLASPEFKRHDEDKVFLGFESTAAARSAYVSHRNDGDQAIGGMSSMPTEAFKAKLQRRSGAGKIRAERDGAAVLMDIVKREDGFHVLSEDHAKHLGGPYASRAEAEKRLAQVEAHKHDRTAKAGRQGQAIRFDSLAAEGKVRTGVWDRICVPGINVKDDEQTEFSAETLSEMARNFAARGDMVMIDWNHQSIYAHENGKPAPALGFYGALAVVFDRQLIACEYARGVDQAPPDVAGLDDGLWGLRSEVTECGHELLPNFKYVSPTFTPMGTDQQSNPIGYCLLAVAATNTPWQAGTQITFDRGAVAMAVDANGQELHVGDQVQWKDMADRGTVTWVGSDSVDVERRDGSKSSGVQAQRGYSALVKLDRGQTMARDGETVACPECNIHVGVAGGKVQRHPFGGGNPERNRECPASGRDASQLRAVHFEDAEDRSYQKMIMSARRQIMANLDEYRVGSKVRAFNANAGENQVGEVAEIRGLQLIVRFPDGTMQPVDFTKAVKMESAQTMANQLSMDAWLDEIRALLRAAGLPIPDYVYPELQAMYDAGKSPKQAFASRSRWMQRMEKMSRATSSRDDVGSRTKMNGPTEGAKTMKNVIAAAQLVGLEGSTDTRAIRAAFVQKFEADGAAALEGAAGEGYGAKAAAYAKLAKLEELAQAYEEAGFEEDEGDEPAHAVMRARLGKLAAKLAGDPPFGGKETPSEEAAEDAVKHEAPTDEAEKHEGDATMEDEKDDKKALQAMARKLGLPPTASAARIATAMEARTVGLDKFGQLEQRLAKMEADKRSEVLTERKRSAEVTFSQAVAHGRTKPEKRDAFIAAYGRDPKDAEALLFTPGTFPSSDVLMSRMTIGGAPAGVNNREGSSMNALDQRVVTMSALGSSAKALVFGETLAAHITAMADSDDPRVRARIDRELPEGTKGTKFESFERYMAAERITKKERPDLLLAASEDN